MSRKRTVSASGGGGVASNAAGGEHERSRDERRDAGPEPPRAAAPGGRELERAGPRSRRAAGEGPRACAARQARRVEQRRHRRIGGNDSRWRVQRQREAPAEEGRAALRQPVEIGDRHMRERPEQLGEPVAPGQQRLCKTQRGPDHPQPHGGRDGRERQEIGRQTSERHGSEVVRHQGRRGERGRDRDRDALAEPVAERAGRARSNVQRGRAAAASSSAIPRSLTASGRPATRMPATATNESCQPGSLHARGFRASVTAAASSSAYQRDEGRESVIAAMPAAPITPARWSDGPAPASGTYNATRQSNAMPRPRGPRPGRGEQRQRQRHQQHHVLPAHRQQMRETGVAPVVACRAVDLLVLAEHHAQGERGVGLREAGGDRLLGAAAQSVERTLDAAASLAR